MTDFKVGDFIVDFENIYQIYDDKDDFFFYHIAGEDKATSTSSLPRTNVSKSGFRHLQTTTEIKEIIKELEKSLPENTLFENKLIKESLYLNDPIKNALTLKLLYKNKKDTGEKFLKSNQEIINNMTNHMAKEISFVLKKQFESVHKQISDILAKA